VIALGVVGDTQGRYRVARLLDFVLARFSAVDEIWHAGDWQDPAVLEGLRSAGKPVLVVNGNAPDDPGYPERVERELEGLRVGMVHRPPKPKDAWASALDLVIHGHTHRWRDEVIDGTRFINVSTPTAAGFTRERTIGIVRLDGRRVELEKIPVALA
jgi:putative phosphoesterase